jgi:hypothetical protein
MAASRQLSLGGSTSRRTRAGGGGGGGGVEILGENLGGGVSGMKFWWGGGLF